MYGGKIIKSQVRLIDVMPTILDFLKIKTDSKLSGFSLLNYLDKNRNKDKQIEFPKYAISEHNTRRISYVSIRTERYKYIDYPYKKDELYDLSKDRTELDNLAQKQPARVARMAKVFEEWRAQ